MGKPARRKVSRKQLQHDRQQEFQRDLEGIAWGNAEPGSDVPVDGSPDGQRVALWEMSPGLREELAALVAEQNKQASWR